MVEMTSYQFKNYITSTVKNITAIEGTEGVTVSQDGETLNVWNVKITDTDSNTIFWYNENLINLDLKGLFIENNPNMGYMFQSCSSLAKLDLSNFDTSNVLYMGNMFADCSSLIELDLSNFNTSNVEDMTFMFAGCTSLTKLDLSSFDTSNMSNADMGYMFRDCSASILIDENKWTVSKTPRDYDSTNISFYKKGAKYLSIYGNDVPIGDVYSTSEIVVGTWIDGKPIYRKVIDVDNYINMSGNIWKDFCSFSDNINIVKCLARDNDPARDIIYPVACYYDSSTSQIKIMHFRNSALNVDRIIVDYTKVSD